MLLNSLPRARLRMAATTLSPTTKARMSLPWDSAIYSWISTDFPVSNNPWTKLFDSWIVWRKNTPWPCVPWVTFITTGNPPTKSIAGSTSIISLTYEVFGTGILFLARNLGRVKFVSAL